VIGANGTGIKVGTFASGNAVSITLRRNEIGSNAVGVDAGSSVAAGSTVVVVLDDNALTGNGTAIGYVSPAVVYSRGNNMMERNGTDNSGPALTSKSGV
jgi:hypothetical protein